jgi:SPP1 family predicted phage head-tail adaptor
MAESIVGKMNKRVVVQQQSRSADTMGGATVSWSTLTTVWAKVTPKSGRESYPNMQTEDATVTEFIMRYLSTVTPAMRLSYNSNVYQITEIINYEEKGKYMKVMATEGVAT